MKQEISTLLSLDWWSVSLLRNSIGIRASNNVDESVAAFSANFILSLQHEADNLYISFLKSII